MIENKSVTATKSSIFKTNFYIFHRFLKVFSENKEIICLDYNIKSTQLKMLIQQFIS